MIGVLVAAAMILLASMSAGLVRIAIGPTAADRMMAAQLAGTTGSGLLLLLAALLQRPALADVALVFALLAVLAVAAFTRRPAAGGMRP